MRHSGIPLIMLVLTIFQASVLAQEPRDQLIEALAKLDEGIVLLEANDSRSSAVLAESAAMFSGIVEEHDLNTPGIYHALGNAYMLKGDLGHAVLAYRRGEQLDPTNHKLRASLDHARALVEISVKPDTQSRVWSVLLVWRGYIPRVALWLGFITLSTLGWVACSSRLLGLGSRAMGITGIWMIVGSMVPLTMLGSEWIHHQGSRDVVIVDQDVIARSGPDDTIYDPVFSQALQPGVEARIIGSRDGWEQLELADGSQCWVPRLSLEEVNLPELSD